MTDREKLIELLGDYFDIGDCTPEDIADHLIANGVTFAKDTDVHSKWISVEEQKPEENKDTKFYVSGNLVFATVLVGGGKKGVTIANRVNVKPVGIPYIDEYATNGWEWSKGNEDVTHWMPLPRPPREE